MLSRNSLFLSIALFLCGIFLINHDTEFTIVNHINHFFHLHLDIDFRSYGLFYCGALLILLSLTGALLFFLQKEIITQRQFYILSTASIVIFYFFFLWKDAVNIPITDDYRLLIFLTEYSGKHSFAEKWQLIIQSPLASRVMEVPKLFVIGIYEIFGSINFKWIILLNGYVLLIISRLLFQSFQHPSKQLFYLAFLFLMLQFQSFDSAFWAVGGISFYWTFLFVILAIRHALKDSNKSLLLSLLFAALASFTLGNGLLAFPICCLALYQRGKIKQVFVCLATMIIIYIIYFYYWPYAQEASQWAFNPLKILIFLLGFLGSSMQFMYSLYLPILTGTIIMAVFIYATIKKYYEENFFTWSILLFIIITAFITAPLRLDMGPLQSRYGLYSIASIVLCIMIVAEMLSKSQSNLQSSIFNFQFPALTLVFAVTYNLLSGIMFYPEAPIRKQKLQTFVNDWKSGKPLSYSPPVIPDEADKYLNAAVKAGLWKDE